MPTTTTVTLELFLIVGVVAALSITRKKEVRRWLTPVPRSFRREVRVACRLAMECGRAIRLATKDQKIYWKSSIDPCTATDERNEILVRTGLEEAFPSHCIIGEEAASRDGYSFESEMTWIVDPIDGTQNFVHGLPCSVVSIGLARNGQAVVGVVFDPHLDELYVGIRGHGAFLDGQRLSLPANETALDTALVLTDPGYERDDIDPLVRVYRNLLAANTRAVRAIGSSVLSLCWVAAGRASAFIIGFSDGDAPKPWDWCAATLIAEEAGAVVEMIDDRRHPGPGGPPPHSSFDLLSKSVLCACDAGLARDIRVRVLPTTTN